MKKLAMVGIFLMTFGASFANASWDDGDDGHDHPRPRPCDDCDVDTKEVCFNLVCNYNDKDNPEGYQHCKVSSTFKKAVTKDGGEVEDDSAEGTNPQLEVECDGNVWFNNSAHRFTDLLGTRIQGETGPFPAIKIPRGQLHGNGEEDSGYHVSPSTLEIDAGHKQLRTKGVCHIWTGAP